MDDRRASKKQRDLLADLAQRITTLEQRLEQRINALESKIDTLIAKPTGRIVPRVSHPG